MCTHSSRLFVFLWSCALVFSGLGTYYTADNLSYIWPSLVGLIAGVALLALPDSLMALRFSAVGYLVSFAAQMPATPNHRWVLLYVALALVGKAFTEKTVEEVARTIRGSLQCLTIVVYGFATLAKLNTTYFDPAISCAALFSRQTFELYGLSDIFGDQTALTTAWVSLLVEALIPILLLWPRARVTGVCLGILFHFVLSLHLVRYFGNFSAIMFVLLFSWLPDEGCKRIWAGIERLRKPALRSWKTALGLLPLLTITSLLPWSEYVIARHVLYLSFAVVLLLHTARAFQVGALPTRDTMVGELRPRVGAPSLLVLAFAVLNSCAPYLGIKTRSALTMYSNLRIEPDYSNHLFMPASADPLGLLSDRVQITDTSNPLLRERLGDGSSRMTYTGFCAYLACQDDLCSPNDHSGVVSYTRANQPLTHKLGTPIPADCPPWIVRKLLFFGPVGPDAERLCIW